MFPIQLCTSCIEKGFDRHQFLFSLFHLMSLTVFTLISWYFPFISVGLIRIAPCLQARQYFRLITPFLCLSLYSQQGLILLEIQWHFPNGIFPVSGISRSCLGSTHVFGSLWFFVLDVFSVSVTIGDINSWRGGGGGGGGKGLACF